MLYLYSVVSVRDRCHFVLNLYMFLLFVPGTNKLKYFFEISDKNVWVVATSVDRSLEGQQTIFFFRPYREGVIAVYFIGSQNSQCFLIDPHCYCYLLSPLWPDMLLLFTIVLEWMSLGNYCIFNSEHFPFLPHQFISSTYMNIVCINETFFVIF